jgi:hypothetical protein
MPEWITVIKSDFEILKYIQVPSGYIYRYIRRSQSIDIGGNKRWEINYETTIHGSMDHSIRKTTDDSKRSLEKKTSSNEIQKIRRRAKKRSSDAEL